MDGHRQQHFAIVVALPAYAARTLPSFFSVLGEVETGKSRENDLFPLRGRERKEEEKGKRTSGRGGKSHLHLRLRARNLKEWAEGAREGEEGLLRVITRIRLKVVPVPLRHISAKFRRHP